MPKWTGPRELSPLQGELSIMGFPGLKPWAESSSPFGAALWAA